MNRITKITNSLYNDLHMVLGDQIDQRMEELYEISKQKGINDFGWKQGLPQKNDCEGIYEAYRNSEVFISIDYDYLLREYAAHRFKFNDKGSLVITAYYDYRDEQYHDNCEVWFFYYSCDNIFNMAKIIEMIERDLGIEQ